jgi:hypothetical protein
MPTCCAHGGLPAGSQCPTYSTSQPTRQLDSVCAISAEHTGRGARLSRRWDAFAAVPRCAQDKVLHVREHRQVEVGRLLDHSLNNKTGMASRRAIYWALLCTTVIGD